MRKISIIVISHMIAGNLLKRLSIVLVVLYISSFLGSALAEDKVLDVLSERHLSVTPEQLERYAGGADNLAERLLQLRHLQGVQFVAERAARALLRYSDRPNVLEGLEGDLGDLKEGKLARVIAVYFSDVPDGEAKHRIAMAILERAEIERSFQPFARMLLEATDPEIRQLAEEKIR